METGNASTPQQCRHRWLGWLLKYAIPVVISFGLCWLLFTGVDFGDMVGIIRGECNFWWIALALSISVLSHILRAVRWGMQLRALGIDTPMFPLILSIFGTYSVNLVFPRLGEVWRTGYIAHRQGAQFATVFGSMVADRLADMFTALVITVFTFILAAGTFTQYVAGNAATYAHGEQQPQPLAGYVSSPLLWIALAACVVLVWWFFAHKTSNPAMLKAKAAVRELWAGFAAIFTMPGKGLWLLLTVGIWGCYFVQMLVVFQAFGFTAEVASHDGVTAVLVTFVLSSIAMGVPSNGGIGPWQWAVIFALGIYGVDRVHAGAFANVVLGTQTLLLIFLGIFTFASIALMRRKARSTQNINNLKK